MFDPSKVGETHSLEYDLDGEGNKDQSRLRTGGAGPTFWAVEFADGKKFSGDTACKRVGVLKTKTNGVSDLCATKIPCFAGMRGSIKQPSQSERHAWREGNVMKKLLTSVFLLILGPGQVQSDESHLPSLTAGSEESTGIVIDWNGAIDTGLGGPLPCTWDSDDYRLLEDGRIVPKANIAVATDVLLTLPAGKWHTGARLLGFFDLDEGAEEAMLGWGLEQPSGDWHHHFQVFSGQRKQEAKLLQEFTLSGAEVEHVRFCRPPKGSDIPKIFIDIQGGAYWGTTYVLMPDGSPQKLFDASSSDFVDLNRDGVYELAAWDWHTPALRCDMSMFGAGPKIYALGTFLPGDLEYRQVWPVEGGPFQIKGLLATLEGERTISLVTLTDRQNEDPTNYGPQYLAVYRVPSWAQAAPPWHQGKALQLVTKSEIPSSEIAFYLSSEIGPDGVRRFLVWCTDRHGCEPVSEAKNGNAIGVDKFKDVYVFRGGRLQRVGTEALGVNDLRNAGQPINRK